jgi:hypothetical protein
MVVKGVNSIGPEDARRALHVQSRHDPRPEVARRRWLLECQAIAPGGWKRVFQVADGVELARRIAWLSGQNVKGETA